MATKNDVYESSSHAGQQAQAETTRLLEQLESQDMAPPEGIPDVWIPMQLWARMIRDG